MSRTKLTWSPRPETSSASAAVRKFALPRQKDFATDSPIVRTSTRRADTSLMGHLRTHAPQQTASLFTVRGAGVALLGRLALTVAQNLGIAADRIHDCGRDEFDTG